MKNLKVAKFIIVLSVITILGGFFGLMESHDKVKLYKPTQEQLQANLDNIDGIGEVLKQRVGTELELWIDDINRTNENKIIIVNNYILFLILICLTGLIGVILSFSYIIIYLHNLNSISEHRDTQNYVAQTYNTIKQRDKYHG